MGLENSQVIGGVVVTIGADTSKYKAGHAEVKRMAAEIDRTTATIKVQYRVERLALPAPAPLVVPVILDTRMAMGQLIGLRTAAGGMGGGGPPLLPGRVGGSIPRQPAFIDAEYTVRSVEPIGRMALPGGGYNGMGYDGGMDGGKAAKVASKSGGLGGLVDKIEELGKTSERSMKIVAGMTKVFMAAEAVMAVGEAKDNMVKAGALSFSNGDPAEIQKYIDKGRGAIQGIPVFGNTIDKMGNRFYSGISSYKNMLVHGQYESDYDYAERTLESSKAQDANTSAGYQKLQILKDRRLKKIAAEDARNAFISAQEQGRGEMEYQFRDASMAAQVERRNNIIASGNARWQAGLDSDSISQQLAQSQMRLSGNFKGAEISELRSQFYAPISEAYRSGDQGKVKGLYDLQNSKEAEIRKRQTDQTNQQIVASEATAMAARLRIVGQGQRAELMLFDQSAKARIDQMRNNGEDEKAIVAEQKATAAQRAELVANQGRENTIFGLSMSTRRAVAGASAAGESILAGVLGSIGGLKSEYAAQTDAKKKAEIATTAQVELSAMRTEMLRPSSYASEGSRYGEAFGGPGGTTGKDIADALKTLSEAIKYFADNRGLPS